MAENTGDVKKLKIVLDDVSPYEKCKTLPVEGDKYVKSVCKRLYHQYPSPKVTMQAPTKKTYLLRPRVEIHYKEVRKEEKKEPEKEEKKKEEKPVEIEVIKCEVKEPEFIRVIPKELVEFKRVKEKIPQWKTVEELPEWVPEKKLMPFVYKGYTLYKRIVDLNSGKKQTIYFFSKKKPKSGGPCALPEKYTVGVNKRSGMPYLTLKKKKEEKIENYEKDGYQLYYREVNLKSGKTQIIYFFSKKKPKSGRRCPLPKNYRVKINKRSKMPYLVKK